LETFDGAVRRSSKQNHFAHRTELGWLPRSQPTLLGLDFLSKSSLPMI
jgi:hypothetical protein